MKQKNDLFEELNINPKNRDVCSPFAVDIQAIKRNVNRTLDSAYTERKTVIMKSKKKICLMLKLEFIRILIYYMYIIRTLVSCQNLILTR